MKSAIILIFVFVLTAGLMAGCRPGSTAESIATEASNIASEIMPDADNGAATDSDGIIGEDNTSRSRSGFTPICE